MSDFILDSFTDGRTDRQLDRQTNITVTSLPVTRALRSYHTRDKKQTAQNQKSREYTQSDATEQNVCNSLFETSFDSTPIWLPRQQSAGTPAKAYHPTWMPQGLDAGLSSPPQYVTPSGFIKCQSPSPADLSLPPFYRQLAFCVMSYVFEVSRFLCWETE